MSEEQPEKTSEAQKLMYAVFGIFVIGFALVWTSKDDAGKGKGDNAEAATMRNYVAMQQMANNKCKEVITEKTGEQVYLSTDTKTDKETYVTLIWEGEKKFKTASCTLNGQLGGISELVIDGKEIINKKIPN
ncbi:MAG: hypothetical protein NTW85_09355 [Methylococcales bacterium]|nr:hypothetical protein [Methylococcales bacterium]